NGRRMSDLLRDSEFVEQLQKPSHGSRGLEPDHDRRRQRRVEVPHRVAFVWQRLLDHFSVSRSNIAIVCWAACKSHPIIFISPSFDPSAVSMDTHSLHGPL